MLAVRPAAQCDDTFTNPYLEEDYTTRQPKVPFVCALSAGFDLIQLLMLQVEHQVGWVFCYPHNGVLESLPKNEVRSAASVAVRLSLSWCCCSMDVVHTQFWLEDKSLGVDWVLGYQTYGTVGRQYRTKDCAGACPPTLATQPALIDAP